MSRFVFYTYPSCTSCRKTKAWLKQNHVDYEERHLFKETPDIDELLNIIKLTREGIKEILATRSETFKNLNVNIDELKVSEVLQLLHDEPRLLRRPILTDGEKLVIGFNKSGLQKISHTGSIPSKNKNVS